jgi:RNA polymerase sigma factor (TIGR02999 family)
MDAEGGNRSGEVTRLLRAARGGDRGALDRVVPLVYAELRALARHQLGREHGARTLHATDLVHEAYLKLAGGPVRAADRTHFLAIAARAMRQVLVDHARARRAAKRGLGWERTTLSSGDWTVEVDPGEVIALDDALEQLEPRQRQIVEYRFFGGMEEREIAELLGVSDRTVRREWVRARAWLYRAIYAEPAAGDGAGAAHPGAEGGP